MPGVHHDAEVEALLAHADWLRALARGLVSDPGTADDLVQETSVLALRRRAAIEGEPRSWLAGVLRRVARRRRRGEGRRARREEAAGRSEGLPEAAGDALARADLQRRLIGMVLALEEPYRATLLLRYFDGIPLEEIARRHGVPASTVRTRAARGLERLRARLSAEHGDRAEWCTLLAPLAAAERGGGTTIALEVLSMGTRAKLGAAAAVAAAGLAVYGVARGRSAEGDGGEPREREVVATVEVGAAAGSAAAEGAAAPSDPAEPDARVAVAPASPAEAGLGTLVFGSVLGGGGERIDQARIAFVDALGATTWASSGAPGTYAVLGLAPGAYRILVGKPGFLDAELAVEIEPGATELRRDLALLAAPSIPVRLVDATGAPLSVSRLRELRAAVIATREPPPRDLPGLAGSEASRYGVGAYDGRQFVSRPIAGIAPEHSGLLRLRAEPPLYASLVLGARVIETQRLEPGLQELVFTVRDDAVQACSGGVRLRLVDARTGEPLTGGQIGLEDGTVAFGGTPIPPDGRVELLDRLPGLYALRAWVKDHQAPLLRVRVTSGVVLDLGDVPVEREAIVRGRVVDESGEPLAVALAWRPVGARGAGYDLEGGPGSRSRIDGAFEVRVPEARVALLVTDDELARSPLLVDARGGDVDGIELVARRGVLVRLRPSAGAQDGMRVTLATEGGVPLHSRDLRGATPIEVRLEPGAYEIRLGWDERVLERRPLEVGVETTVVDLPALEPPR